MTRAPARWLAALMALTLSACESSVDRQRAEICRRAVPALGAVRGESQAPARRGRHQGRRGAGRLHGFRAPGQTGRQRWVACGFGPGAELLALATEGGPVGGANLYLLRHYYLDTPEAAAADPGVRGAEPP